jgi:bifunctional UDP-N-acetylglucosamine pyrophosphorylase/glucosamine-1-phosphate N-acetyltransferase
VAAGSTITKDVPGEALSIARAKQVNKENYVQKLNLKK